jgi:hypothetical protein
MAVVSTAGPAAAAPPPTGPFEKVRLDGGLSMGEPIELSVLPDGKVLYINRGTSSGGGQVRLYNPATGLTTVALTLQLDARFEAAVGDRVRAGLPDPGIEQQHKLDDVFSTTTGDGGVDDLNVTGSGRWVRIYGTQRATQWGYSLWEFDVFGT